MNNSSNLLVYKGRVLSSLGPENHYTSVLNESLYLIRNDDVSILNQIYLTQENPKKIIISMLKYNAYKCLIEAHKYYPNFKFTYPSYYLLSKKTKKLYLDLFAKKSTVKTSSFILSTIKARNRNISKLSHLMPMKIYFGNVRLTHESRLFQQPTKRDLPIILMAKNGWMFENRSFFYFLLQSHSYQLIGFLIEKDAINIKASLGDNFYFLCDLVNYDQFTIFQKICQCTDYFNVDDFTLELLMLIIVQKEGFNYLNVLIENNFFTKVYHSLEALLRTVFRLQSMKFANFIIDKFSDQLKTIDFSDYIYIAEELSNKRNS